MSDAAWQELDALHVWHPYTQHGAAAPPIPIVSARGAYLYDAAGRPILDAISSWWVTLHGHAHPDIVAAVAAQAARLDQVIFAGCTHEPAARLAAELLAILPPGLTRVFYSDDGSTAVEVALKMALQSWRLRGEPRSLVVALEHAYHGDTFGAMSASARGAFTAPFGDQLFEVARLPDPVAGDPVAAFTRLLTDRPRDVAALIVEPTLLGAGGMRVWSGDTLRRLHRLAHDAGVLFIADEVLTGFGRTGPLFACGGAEITPDIICLSKGLTGGVLPLGVTATTEALFALFRSEDRAKTFFHGHSFTANPIACAAARASLALLGPSCDARRRMIADEHRRQLTRFDGDRRVRHPRVLGTMAAFDVASTGGYLDPIGPRLHAFALANGVLLRPLGNVVYLLPPYCIGADELARAYDVVERFLATEAP